MVRFRNQILLLYHNINKRINHGKFIEGDVSGEREAGGGAQRLVSRWVINKIVVSYLCLACQSGCTCQQARSTYWKLAPQHLFVVEHLQVGLGPIS